MASSDPCKCLPEGLSLTLYTDTTLAFGNPFFFFWGLYKDPRPSSAFRLNDSLVPSVNWY